MRHYRAIPKDAELSADEAPGGLSLVMWRDDLPPDPEHRCYAPDLPESAWCRPPESED